MNHVVADVMHTIEKYTVELKKGDKEEIRDFVRFVLEDKLKKEHVTKTDQLGR